MSVPVPGHSGPPRGTMTAAEIGAWDGVDGYLFRLFDGIAADLWILDGERPERLDELLDRGETEGVRVRRSAP